MSNHSKMGVPPASEDLKSAELRVSLPAWIIKDLALMEKNTQRPQEDLVKTALMMFIATHNDYLGVHKNNK